MVSTRVILLCENDYQSANILQTALEVAGYDVHTIDEAVELIPTTIRTKPAVILVNPDMKGFNPYDVCKHLIKDMSVPVFLLIDRNSATTGQIDACQADEVITKPLDLDTDVRNLLNLIEKQIAVQ